ncbi:MAG TPA: methyltransferase, partial [Thermoanaerobaculia bacterium]|nr:methyltransferase [Thermoanaerobaculia bacterium]
ARSIMAATRFGFFQTLTAGPLTAEEVALQCGTHPRASRVLLDTMATLGYVHPANGRYELTGEARKWLLADSPKSLHDSIVFRYLEWDWIARLDDFVRTGQPLSFHAAMTSEEWALYQRGMSSLARFGGGELAQKIPVPAGARDLLDIGGSHGLLSVALCRKHAHLRAVVLDLPSAVEHAAPILKEAEMGDRVVHREGDALADDLGSEAWDVVLLANLSHHFDDATNRELTRRVARALRPGGIFAIVEILRRESPKEGGQMGALFDLYFALTSESGTWSFAEMSNWQREAGLHPRHPVRLRTSPGYGLQVAVKA